MAAKPTVKTEPVKAIDYGELASQVAEKIVASYKSEFEDMDEDYKDKAMAAVKDYADLQIQLALAQDDKTRRRVSRNIALAESTLVSYEAIGDIRMMKATCTIVGQAIGIIAIAALKMV